VKAVHIVTALLAVSVLVNIGFIAAYNPYEQARISSLVAKTSSLSVQNMELQKQLNSANISLTNAASQLDFYRSHLSGPEEVNEGFVTGITSSATMEAPAVSQQVELVQNGPFVTQNVITNGSIMNISVDVQPGKGRVLVDTTPLMGIVFQDAANTAVFVAQNKTGRDLSGSDVLFSIQADKAIDSVDGPSAGALMTLVSIAALENRHINASVTLTGTIDSTGHVGAIGGAVEKAAAAKASGLTTFLMPLENKDLTVYTQQSVDYGGYELIEQVPQSVPAKEYIEKNVGINVEYVDNIDDVLADALT